MRTIYVIQIQGEDQGYFFTTTYADKVHCIIYNDREPVKGTRNSNLSNGIITETVAYTCEATARQVEYELELYMSQICKNVAIL
jgi:hypothetical protein